MVNNIKFSILITTKNRIGDLKITLQEIDYLLIRNDLECFIFDDGSIDGTLEFIKLYYPQIRILRNEISKGYIYCRNSLLNETNAKFAITLDDDAHFITKNPLETIESYFNQNEKCALIAFRVFWDIKDPINTDTTDLPCQVQSFVGCGHVWRIEAWKSVSSYPEWFKFYGEEDFASIQLFKLNKQVHYLPEILVKHRVDIKARKKNADYINRLRYSLRSGWFLYFLFLPFRNIPKLFLYSIWIQFKSKIFKGDLKVLIAVTYALTDLMLSIPKIFKTNNRFTIQEYKNYKTIPPAKIFWDPNKS
jgi:glycosyltransferase involved in cell wall biosynthesis